VLRPTLILIAALAAVLGLVAASPGATSPPQFPVTIKAANGDVVIKQRPTRVVSLSPSATEDLFAVGADAQVVAVDDQSDYPKRAPRTKLSGFTPNTEAIAAYNPDLVVISNDGGLAASLEKLGITVLLEPAPDTIAQAYDEIRQIGRATGHADGATRVVRGMQSKLTALIRSVPKKSRHLSVFHELSPDYYSATSATFIGRVYKLFGFRNIADAADSTNSGYPQLSAEYIVSTNPQIVVLADSVCCGQTAASVGPRIVDFARVIATVAKRS